MAAPTILILLHERDRRAAEIGYWIWTMREAWQEMGLRVDVVRGTRRAGPADLLFPHVDLTVTPAEYLALYDRYPRVVNRFAVDHSKRSVSANLVRPGDAWDGRVIVKTDRNSGGLRDLQLLATYPELVRRRLRTLFGLRVAEIAGDGPIDFASVRCMPPTRYPVFDSLQAVPRQVFDNPSLVVERLLTERVGELYCLRSYAFLGDRWHFQRQLGTEPVVKARACVADEDIADDDGAIPMRTRLGLDYGKLDYVVRDEGRVLFDVNTTPAYSSDAPDPVLIRRSRLLAAGVRNLLEAPA